MSESDREVDDETIAELNSQLKRWEEVKKDKPKTLSDEDYKKICEAGFRAFQQMLYICGL